MKKEIIASKKAPAAIGPYSQGTKVNGFVFTSGQLPINPETGQIDENNIEWQTHQALKNLGEVLKEAGSDLTKVTKTTVYLKDLSTFAKVNEIYASYFKSEAPARSCFEVAKLPKDALIEIEAIAFC